MNQIFRDSFENAHKWKLHQWKPHEPRTWCTYFSLISGRNVNRIIAFQTNANMILMPISLLYLCGMWWSSNLSYYISKEGCYFGTYLGMFHINFMQCHSFTLCMFRFICIIHPKKLAAFGLNAPQVMNSLKYISPIM